MKNVLLKGPLLSTSGYGVHSRQIFEYLKTRKDINLVCDITSWGTTSWRFKKYKDKSYSNINEIMESFKPRVKISSIDFDETYQICLPNEWKKISSFDVGITAGVETDICKPSWLIDINKMDKVIVPSCFTKETFINTSKKFNIDITTNIDVIPEYYHEEFDLENKTKLNILNKIKTQKNILLMGQFTAVNKDLDRKNIFNTIEIVVRELSKIKGFGLIIKTNLGKNSHSDYYKVVKLMNEYICELKRELGESIPNIYILHGDMSPLELKSVYESNKVSCFVSCTKGEGFGLHFLESAVCGLPIIATNWSAYKEYLDYFLKVDFDLNEVSISENNKYIFQESSMWAEFKKESLIENLHKVFNSNFREKEEVVIQKKKLLNKYNKKTIINLYTSSLSR